MTGDQADMAARLRAALPGRWFGDAAPVLDGVLAGIGAIWAAVHTQLQAAISQTRIATATGPFLDMIALDFFGRRLRQARALLGGFQVGDVEQPAQHGLFPS